ncbi:uncharacterized protein, partial [Argopecten irradians]|uniref:uncharacterized protein n=1 Tax=Argopecten irradians TaxID=31199 RepID=UPI0037242C71
FDHLSNESPQTDLSSLPCSTFIPDQEDLGQLRSDFAILIARVVVPVFPHFGFLKAVLPKHIKEENVTGLKEKNCVVPLPVLRKNEQKYTDVVDILDSYVSVIKDIYTQAGVEVPNSVHVGGDQLTRERFSGAKRLRSASLTEDEKCSILYPVAFELFHTEMALLTLFYQVLYSENSTDIGSLYSQKIRLNRRHADGKDVKNHYDSCIIECVRSYFGFEDTQSSPTVNTTSVDTKASKKEIYTWMIHTFGKVVDEIIWKKSIEHIQRTQNQPQYTQIFVPLSDGTLYTLTVPVTPTQQVLPSEEPDSVNLYAKNVLELGLLIKELHDIIHVPIRNRLLPCLKYLMLVFKGHNNRSKYALEILRFLFHQTAILSEKVTHESLYGLFVNTQGKIDSNIPADLEMEYQVRHTKDQLRAMCANKSYKSMSVGSSAFAGMQEISTYLSATLDVIVRYNRHNVPSSAEDEQLICKDLLDLKPGRRMSCMKVSKSPITKLDMGHLFSWIESHKKTASYELG